MGLPLIIAEGNERMSEIDVPTITAERSVSPMRKSYCPPTRRVSLQSLDGTWGVKCRKVYELDTEGNCIPDGKGDWENHKEDAND